MKLDIICPVYKDFESFKNLYYSFSKQKDVEIKQVICPLTQSENDEEMINFFSENNIVYFAFPKEKFSHYKTREEAVNNYSREKCVVFMSQDIKLENEYALYNLAKPVEEGKAAYTYGRQIAKKKCIEKYIREKNYPDMSKMVRPEDVNELQIMAFFASDAFSCIDREVFIQLGGYQGYDSKTNEDQLYSYILLNSGYSKMYCADAVCEHYHKYSLKQLYRRYYETGEFYKETKVLSVYRKNNSGMELALYVLKRIFMNFDIISLFKYIPNMAARYIGMKKGEKQK